VTDEAKTPISQGLLDTSVVLAIEQVPAGSLPLEPAIAAVTLAELAAGPHATDDPEERARRQDRLQRIEALLDPLPAPTAASTPPPAPASASPAVRGRWTC